MDDKFSTTAAAEQTQARDEAARSVRLALNSLREGIEVAIRSAGTAYQFSANAYTAEALSDATSLRNLVALVIGRVTAITGDDR
jgi:hypothetical protein